ncbi:S41 family peptidase [Bauldia sp.]|uniref:S41 family peptidase n=1 Tax=Bauldia sp. TaxID=2575872 RepID=UPI003BAD1C1B
MIRKATFLLAGVAFGAAVAVTLTQTQFFSGSPANAASADTYRELNLFGDVFERIRSDYVELPDESILIESAINGMLAGLDPHSSYLSPKHFKDMQVQTTGKFGGLGIEVTMEEGVIKVVSPIDDTPAARAGVLANDLIIALDDEEIEGLTLTEAVERMRGPVNTPIVLTIKRENVDEPIEIELVREEITLQSVRSREEEDDIGYVRITTFNEQTFDGLKDAIEDLNEEIGEARVKGYVIDLRNNPGGLLDQAVAVSDAFLDRGEIVSTRTRHAEETQRYNAHVGDLAEGRPVIILVNGGSASASEIVAGALQDHRRATIIGSRSFGKGSVQTIIPLGANGALRLTTARYYTPAGRSIQAKGIDPDIEVDQDLPPELAEAADEIEPRGEASLRGHLEGEDAVNGEEEESGSLAYVPADPEEDDQLNYALDLLNGLQVNSEFPPDPGRGIPN